jgi:hypothetical protein
MTSLIEIYGKTAGIVYEYLKERDPQNISQIKKGTKLKEGDVFIAIGWLGREGKLKIIEEDNKRKYTLA